MLAGKTLDLTIYKIINKNVCGLKAAQIHEQPFRAAKDLVQPSAAQDSFLPYGHGASDFPCIYHPYTAGRRQYLVVQFYLWGYLQARVMDIWP